jgi:hypothetical protein
MSNNTNIKCPIPLLIPQLPYWYLLVVFVVLVLIGSITPHLVSMCEADVKYYIVVQFA